METTTTINIGLENNALFDHHSVTESIGNILRELRVIGNVSRLKIVNGEWNGELERTLVVEFDSLSFLDDGDTPVRCLQWITQTLCDTLTQDAIALSSGHLGVDLLVHSSDILVPADAPVEHTQPDLPSFNPNFFLRF